MATTTFAPHQPSPLARANSPFKDPRTPPSTPAKTAKLWDEYEKRAVENARRREGSHGASRTQRTSTSDTPRTSATFIASARSSFDFKFRSRTTTSSIPMAICKTCKQPISYASGLCEPCKKTVILSTSSTSTTTSSSPTATRNASIHLQDIDPELCRQDTATPKASSPKRKSFCPMPTQLLDPPIRLSLLRPPPVQEAHSEATRSRKISLTDPNEPFLRLQIAPTTPYPRTSSVPTTPTYPPTTPPSTSHSRTSTRPSSFANTVSPLSPTVHIPTHPYGRQNSAAPSDGSTLYPHTSLTASVNTTGYSLHHATSAWDDWDSDEERSGFLWKGIGKPGKEKTRRKDRSDSKTSLESMSAKLSFAREEERKKTREQRRSEELVESGKKSRTKRSRGFVRVFSCGGCGDE